MNVFNEDSFQNFFLFWVVKTLQGNDERSCGHGTARNFNSFQTNKQQIWYTFKSFLLSAGWTVFSFDSVSTVDNYDGIEQVSSGETLCLLLSFITFWTEFGGESEMSE